MSVLDDLDIEEELFQLIRLTVKDSHDLTPLLDCLKQLNVGTSLEALVRFWKQGPFLIRALHRVESLVAAPGRDEHSREEQIVIIGALIERIKTLMPPEEPAQPIASIKKVFISPDDLRRSSFRLGQKVVESGFKPDYLVALWRGGAPIGCYIHELLKFKNIESDHIAIRTSRYVSNELPTKVGYTGIDETNGGEGEVIVHNLGYLKDKIQDGQSILLVDDVWDSGTSIDAFVNKLRKEVPDKTFQIQVATVYFKPKRNKSERNPNFFLHVTDDWLVFPHELEGLSEAEVLQHTGMNL